MDLPIVPENRLCSRYVLHILASPAIHERGGNTGPDGFVAINNVDSAWSTTFQTGLPSGSYCNVIDGPSSDGTCTGSAYVSFPILLL